MTGVRSLDVVEVVRSGQVSPALSVALSHRVLNDAAATCTVSWGQDAAVTGRVRHPWEVGWQRPSGTPIEVRAAVDGGDTTRLFVGTVDGGDVNLKSGQGTSTVVDRITRLQQRVAIPPVAWTMPPHRQAKAGKRHVGLWGTWIAHHVMQRAGFHANAALQASAVYSQSMAGSAWLASDPDHATNTLGELTVVHRLGNPDAAPQVMQGTNVPCMENVYSLGMTRTRRRSSVDAWQLTVDMASDAPTVAHVGHVDLRTMPVSRGAGVRLEWTQTLVRVHRLNTDGSTVLLGQAARAVGGTYTMRWSVVARPDGSVTLMGSDGRGVVATWTGTGVALEAGAAARGTVRVECPGPVGHVQVGRSDSTFLVTQAVSARIHVDTFVQRSLPGFPYTPPTDALTLLKQQAVAEDALLWVDRAGHLRYAHRALLEGRPQVATVADTGGGVDLNELAVQAASTGPYSRVDVHADFTVAMIRDNPTVLLAVGQAETVPRGDKLLQFLAPFNDESWLQDAVDTSLYMAGNPYPPPTNKELDGAWGSWAGGHLVDADGEARGWALPHHLGWSLNAGGELLGALELFNHQKALVSGTVATPAGMDLSTLPQPTSRLPEHRKAQPLAQLRGTGKLFLRRETTTVQVTGDEAHQAYDHEGGPYLQNSTWRSQMAQRLARRALNPQPTVTLRVGLHLGIEVGDRIKVEHRSTARLDLDCLVVGVSFSLPAAEMNLEVVVLAGHDLGWDEANPLPPPVPVEPGPPEARPDPVPPIDDTPPPTLPAPPKPAPLVVDVDANLLRVAWNGLAAAGGSAVDDERFGALEVVADPAPEPTTDVGRLAGGTDGWWRLTHGPVPLDSTWHVRGRILSPWGVAGPWSDTTVAVVRSLVDPDQFDDARQAISDASAWISESGATLDTLLGGPNVIPQAVIDHLWARVVRARQITTDMLLVGAGDNLVPDPYFTSTELNAARLAASDSGWTMGTNEARLVGSQSARTFRAVAAAVPPEGSAPNTPERFVPVQAGHTYRIRYERHHTTTGLRSASSRPMVRWLNMAGATATTVYPRASYTAPGAVGVWEWDEVEWTAPATAAAVYVGVQANAGTGNVLAVRNVSVTSKTDGSLIVDGAILANHINAQSVAAALGEFITVKANNILAGIINVALELGTSGGVVRAGDADGRAAELTRANGLQLFSKSEEANAQRRLSGQLGGPGGDELTLYQTDGTEGVHVSATDGVVTSMLEVGGDPIMYGRHLLGGLADAAATSDAWLLDLPQGAVSAGSLTGDRTTPVGGHMGYGDIAFEAVDGRTYMIVQSPGAWTVASSSGSGRVDFIHRWTWDGSQPSLSSTLRGYKHMPAPNNGFQGFEWVSVMDCQAGANLSNNSNTLHIPPGLLRMLTQVSAQNCQVTSGSGSLASWLRVFDMGRAAPSTTNVNDGGAQAAPPATVYRSYWQANQHRNWNALSQETYPASAALLAHGIYPWNTGLGQRRAVALFTAANSVRASSSQPGHTNVSMDDALSGRTILRAWVQLWCTETGQSGGATLQLDQYAGTSLPSTLSTTAPTVTNAVRAGAWVSVAVPPSWFNSTSERGIKTSTLSSSASDFARYAGSGDTNGHRPRVILEYT